MSPGGNSKSDLGEIVEIPTSAYFLVPLRSFPRDKFMWGVPAFSGENTATPHWRLEEAPVSKGVSRGRDRSSEEPHNISR